MEKDTGSILKLYPLGENGLIVCWCTAGHGLIRTAARNARTPGSELAGRIDLFHECELTFRPAKQGDLYTLTSATLLSPRLGLRQNLTKLRLAGYMAQLLTATVEPGAADPAWHELIAGALNYVEQTAPRAAVLYHFEKRMAELHGIHLPGTPAYPILMRHFQSLPAGRAELLQQLTGADA